MPRVGYNPDNVTIKTGVGTTVDKAFIAHVALTAAEAAATDADAVLPLTNLGSAAADVETGFTDPPVPRNIVIAGNVSSITGDVVVTGTDWLGDELTETIAANGTSVVAGAKAFRSVTEVNLPAQTHTPAAQTETKEVTAAVSSAGDVTLALTSTALGDASPKDVVVALLGTDDSVTKVAAKMVIALNADEDVGAHFLASNEAGVITLTALTPLANDATLSLAFTDTDTTGVTMGASTNGTAGVPYDKISLGFGDLIGLPYLLSHNTVLVAFLNNVKEATAPTVATSATAISGNTVDLDSALNGTAVDIYLIV